MGIESGGVHVKHIFVLRTRDGRPIAELSLLCPACSFFDLKAGIAQHKRSTATRTRAWPQEVLLLSANAERKDVGNFDSTRSFKKALALF